MKNHYRIVALADLHIGGQRWGVDAARWNEPVWEAMGWVNENGADVIAIAGDLFHRRGPMPDEYRSALDALLEPGLPLLIVDGNHDIGAVKGALSAVWPFGMVARAAVRSVSGQVGLVTWTGATWTQFGDGVQFVALPWPRLIDYGRILPDSLEEKKIADARQHCLRLLKEIAESNAPYWPRVLIGHAMLSYGGIGDPRDPGLLLGKDIVLPASQLPKVDAYLFGHVHQADTWYIGSTQPTDFSDTGTKSFRVVDLTQQDDGTWKTEIQRIPYTSSLKLWDCGLKDIASDNLRARLNEAYRQECMRRGWSESPRFDVARCRVEHDGSSAFFMGTNPAQSLTDINPGALRQIMQGYADRVVSVEVVKPPTVARRLGEDGPVIATLNPDAALEAWLAATGKATDATFRTRVLAEFHKLAALSNG